MNAVIREKDSAAHQNYGENCHQNVEWHTEFVCVHIVILAFIFAVFNHADKPFNHYRILMTEE